MTQDSGHTFRHLVGRVAGAGGRTGEPLVYWAGEYRALTVDQLANAADGLAVAYHVFRRLLTVLRRGDPEAAREEMRKHLDAVRHHLQIG